MATERWISAEMRSSIGLCLDCHAICVETVAHCLGRGGEHAAVEHMRLLLDCAEICATAADFMSRGSDLHKPVCGLCADTCDLCAKSCDALNTSDAEMKRCADLCRECADACRGMSRLGAAA